MSTLIHFFGSLLLTALIIRPGLCDCSRELLSRAKLSASSELGHDRSAKNAILDGGGAWTASQSDFGQYLLIDFQEKRNITSIVSKGKQYTEEYVPEFRIEFGNDGQDFSSYRDRNGNVKLFEGNRDGNTAKRNVFDTPIIAQYIRINPTRWRDRISMRVQLYGCDYVAQSANFDGQSYVVMNLKSRPIVSYEDLIRFRFRTNHANGNLLYSKGTQGDLLSLRLEDNKLVISLDLGGEGKVTTLSAGSLLDDNLWHDVLITRNKRDILFTVDRVIVRKKLTGDFVRLDLNHELYIGGLAVDLQRKVDVISNFTGCIENLMLNNTNTVSELESDQQQYLYKRYGNIMFTCRFQQVIPITFTTLESHLKVDGFFQASMNVSFDFRTFDLEGVLLYNKFSNVDNGFVQIYLEKGKIYVKIKGKNTPADPIIIDPFPNDYYNNGLWHRTALYLGTDEIVITINGRPSTTTRKFSMQSGLVYLIGGGVYGETGFIGCIRFLYIQGKYLDPTALSTEKIVQSRQGNIIFDACQMNDKCHPNPCEHLGTCRQNHLDFTCDCSHTGYSGAVCHVAKFALSCQAHRISDPKAKKAEIDIDVDGSGPMEPFPVTCNFFKDGRTETVLHHRTERPMLVTGFDAPGSYSDQIQYATGMNEIVTLVNRSYTCKQSIKYECKNARLFNTIAQKGSYQGGGKFSQAFAPFSWWVSRSNQKMDYWGGSLPGSRKCSCGLYGTCRYSGSWCNCDSYGGQLVDQWLSDQGDIVEKDFLPVKEIRIGDTGAYKNGKKEAKYTLGPLVCEGDSTFQNAITFRYTDATLDLPTFEMGYSGDIYLQFKTTTSEGVLIHSTGPNDYIKLSITGPKSMQFTLNGGNGPEKVEVETSYRINDNEWHSVLLERNRKQAKLTIDRKFDKKKDSTLGPARPLHLTSYLVVGANVDFREGYVGCIRALLLNGQFIDLRKYAEEANYGISTSCEGKCESSPCLNNGTCIERYSSYTCECQWTAFKGPICADEIGVNLRSDNYIKYNFETSISTLQEHIRVGFTTTEHRGLIFGVSSYVGEYLNLVMSNSGHLRLVFDFGFERREIIIKNENFALGQHHDITIKRSEHGSRITIYVDRHEPIVHTFPIGEKADAQFTRLKSIYIGRNETMDTGQGFVGCISRISFDDHFPLRRLFQENRRGNVEAFPNIESVREDTCGLEPIRYPEEIQEKRPPRDRAWNYHKKSGSSSNISAIIGGVVAAIILIIILALVASGRFVHRQKGDYVTHEDTGARDALDPDTAVVKGKTGADISKKKEYFI